MILDSMILTNSTPELLILQANLSFSGNSSIFGRHSQCAVRFSSFLRGTFASNQCDHQLSKGSVLNSDIRDVGWFCPLRA